MATDRVRDEAERLVSAAITAVSFAARGMGVTGRAPTIATGSAECCVCPVCRVIAAMRDPSSEMADRLASGAGDLATAVTSVLRTLARGGSTDDRSEPSREGDEFWESLRDRATAEATGWRTSSTEEGDPWRAATTGAAPSPMAKKVVKKAVKKVAPPAADRPEPEPGPSTEDPNPAPAPVKKAAPAAKKAAAKKATPAKKAAPEKATAPAKKAAAKKAVPPPEEFG